MFSAFWFDLVRGYFKFGAAALCLSEDKFFSIDSLMFLASVDFPMPGRPTGTKNSFLTDRMSSVDNKSTRNFNSAL